MTGQRHQKPIGPVPVRGDCPTPTKRGYYSRKFAKAVLKQLKQMPEQRKNSKRNVYLCVCGQFHTGTLHEATRAQAAVIAGRKLDS